MTNYTSLIIYGMGPYPHYAFMQIEDCNLEVRLPMSNKGFYVVYTMTRTGSNNSIKKI